MQNLSQYCLSQRIQLKAWQAAMQQHGKQQQQQNGLYQWAIPGAAAVGSEAEQQQ